MTGMIFKTWTSHHKIDRIFFEVAPGHYLCILDSFLGNDVGKLMTYPDSVPDVYVRHLPPEEWQE